MAKFIEVLHRGLTVQGRVCNAGQRVQVRDSFPMASKKEQAERWGAPRYRQISRADFEAVGGSVKAEPAPAAGVVKAEAKEAAKEAETPAAAAASAEVTETTETTEDQFAAFDGLNVEDTLQKAADLSEDALQAFIAWEQTGQARKGVLVPLGVGDDDASQAAESQAAEQAE